MAELGLAANLAGVIGAGLALSKVLYDFASTLGSASKDLTDLATDISLFCSVLKHVQTTLTRAKAYRLSMSALQTAEDIIDRSQSIFADLKGSIDKLRKGDARTELLTRIKWYFKEKRVLLVHEQLKTCTATLHLMLTTLTLAQKIAIRRLSLEPKAEDDQDSQDRLMTHNLFRAQQAASERLAAAEDELILEESARSPNPSSSDNKLAVPNSDIPGDETRPRHRRNRSSQMVYGAIHSPSESPSPRFDRHKRLSVIVADHINRLSLVNEAATIEGNRLSILQTDELLRNWTDQSDPLAADDGLEDDNDEDADRQDDNELPLDDKDMPIITPSDEHSKNSSPDASEPLPNDLTNTLSALEGKPVIKPVETQDYPGTEIFKSFRIRMEDPLHKVLPMALKGYNISKDWREYLLFVVCGDEERGIEERVIEDEEIPLMIFKQLDCEGKKPMFMLRRRSEAARIAASAQQSPKAE